MIVEAHGNGWKQFFGGMNNVPLRHDGKAFDGQYRDTVFFAVAMQSVLRKYANAQAASHRFLDGFIAAQLHSNVGAEFVLFEMLIDAHTRARTLFT